MATARRHAPSHLLLAALLPRRSGRLPRAPRTPLTFLSLARGLSPSLALSRAELVAAARRSHAYRAPLASPCRLKAPPPSITPPRASPKRRTPQDDRLDSMFKLRSPAIALDDSSSSARPRLPRASLRDLREPCRLSPLFSLRNAPSSRPNHRSRLLLAAGHGAAVARATPACARACYQVRRPPRSPQRPSVSPLVHRSAVFDLGRTPAAT